MPADPALVVVDVIGRLQQALRRGDVEAAVACFAPDGALFGSDLGEEAHGHDELRRVFDTLVDRGISPDWELDADGTHVETEADLVRFVLRATVCTVVLGRRTRPRRCTVSGSLRPTGDDHHLELFNGLDPILARGLHVAR